MCSLWEQFIFYYVPTDFYFQHVQEPCVELFSSIFQHPFYHYANVKSTYNSWHAHQLIRNSLMKGVIVGESMKYTK